MNYKDVIIPEKLNLYIEQHKWFYRTLSSMIFDISFIEACYKLQNFELDSDWVSVKFLYRDVYENLILKVYRCFFDNSGNDAINIKKFKNSVVSEYLDSKYKNRVIQDIIATGFDHKSYQNKLKGLEQNVLALRDNYIAHGLLAKQSDEVGVDLKDIRELVDKGIALFQALSFEPQDFYSWIEGDGYDFAKEFAFTKDSTELFVKYSMLSSRYISEIECSYSEYISDEEKVSLDRIIEDINTEKRLYEQKKEERKNKKRQK